MIVESLRLGCAPEIEDWRMEMTPVDFVAATMVHIASDPDSYGGTYHLANPEPPLADDVFDLLEEQGYPLERVPYDEWLQRIDAVPAEEGTPGEIVSGAAPAAEELRDDNTYDDNNTRRILGSDGPTRPAIDEDLLETYAQYFAERGWIEASTRHQAKGISTFEPQLVAHTPERAVREPPNDECLSLKPDAYLTYVHVRSIDFEDLVEAHDFAHDLIQVLLCGGRTGQYYYALSDVAHPQVRAVEQFGHVVLDALDVAEEGVLFRLAGVGVDVDVVAGVSGVRGVGIVLPVLARLEVFHVPWPRSRPRGR